MEIKYTHIGGQAVMEGVMMRGKNCYVLSVRNPSKEIETVKKVTNPTSKKKSSSKIPIIRGIVSFVSSMVVGMKVIYDSAEMAGLDDLTEENPSKFDKWLENKFGDKLYDYIMTFSVIIAIGFSVLLFMVLPVGATKFLTRFVGDKRWVVSVTEGVVRLVIFLAYIFLISKMKEIKRIFGYHGAEHKTINCYEHGEELTVENVRKHSRLHKRCGTSFLLIVMIISMIFFFFVNIENLWLKVLSRILLVPIIAGVSYEVLRWSGRSDSKFVSIISYPGMSLQKITTNEPEDDQIEVAIEAMKGVLRDEGEDV